MDTILIQLTAAQVQRLRHVAREDGLSPEAWAEMIVADALAPYLTYTLDAVSPQGASIQVYCAPTQIYHRASDCDEKQLALYRHVVELIEQDPLANRRKAISLLTRAGFQVTESD